MSKAGTLRSPKRLALPFEFPAWWWRAAVFIVMILIYAFFSSSTPDEFGIPEAFIGLLLLVFVGSRVAILSLGGFLLQRQNAVPSVAYWCFMVMMLVPSGWGLLVNGNTLSNYFRDAIPLLYLFLPIFFVPQMIHQRAAWQKLCVAALCVIGVAYSVRHFMSDEFGIAALGQQIIFGDKHYFPMNPAVLFASTFLLTSGLVYLFDRKWLNATLLLLLGVVAFASLIGMLVRAQIFLVLLSLIFVLFYQFLRYPRTLGFLLIPFCVLLIFAATGLETDSLDVIFDLIVAKTENAGFLNARDIEFQVVIANAMSGLDKLSLGEGWGGLIDNPAGGGVVRFTHNLEIYGLLKGGLIGAFFVGLYTVLNVRIFIREGWGRLVQQDIKRLPLLWAIGNVLCLNLLAEPGFKMFSFGLVLTVLWLYEPLSVGFSSTSKPIG